MRARLSIAAALVVALVTMASASMSTARVPEGPAALDPAAFEAIEGTDLGARFLASPEPTVSAAPPSAIDDFGDGFPSVAPRPQPSLAVAPRVVAVATPRPKSLPFTGGNALVSGTATWYCKTGVSACHYQYPGGMYAAAGPALRVGNWRGRNVRVCGNGRCVVVKLVDWCACGGGRVIDLYSDAFQRLAPLSSGTIRVTVSW